jgi:hypothetical protein
VVVVHPFGLAELEELLLPLGLETQYLLNETDAGDLQTEVGAEGGVAARL